MTKLEIKKLKVQFAQVSSAKMAMELNIDERMDEIQRIQKQIDIQTAREDELKIMIEEAEKASS